MEASFAIYNSTTAGHAYAGYYAHVDLLYPLAWHCLATDQSWGTAYHVRDKG